MKKLTLLSMTLAIAGTAQAEVPQFKIPDHPDRDIVRCRTQRMDASSSISRSAEEDDDLAAIITVAPEGTRQNYTRDSYSLVYSQTPTFRSCGATHVIDGDDGYTYLYNPYSGWNTATYLKGKRDGDRIICQLPQPVYSMLDWSTNEPIPYYADLFEYDATDPENPYVLSEQTEIVFTVKDGVISLDLGNNLSESNLITPKLILGMSDSEGQYANIAECQSVMTPFYEQPVEVPETLQTELWNMICKPNGHHVKVGIDGNDIYLANFDINVPDAVLKGRIENDKAIFPSGQFIGTLMDVYYLWFSGAKVLTSTQFEKGEELIFNYDAENKTLTCGQDDMMIISSKPDQVEIMSYYQNPLFICKNTQTSFKPAAPNLYSFYNGMEEAGYNRFDFQLPNYSTEYDLLDPLNMYYEVYFDSELFTFRTDEFTGLSEDMTQIPYDFTDYMDFMKNDDIYTLYYYTDDLETIGFQLFNRQRENVYGSDLVTYNFETGEIITTGLTTPIIGSPLESVSYYTLQGQPIKEPTPGICIKVTEDGNGHRAARKVLIIR